MKRTMVQLLNDGGYKTINDLLIDYPLIVPAHRIYKTSGGKLAVDVLIVDIEQATGAHISFDIVKIMGGYFTFLLEDEADLI